MNWFFIITSIILLILLLVSVYIAVRFANSFFRLEEIFNGLSDDVEESLDILRRTSNTISQIAGYEVVSDEPYVRRVVDSINAAGLSVMKVSNKMSSVYTDVEEFKADKENND